MFLNPVARKFVGVPVIETGYPVPKSVARHVGGGIKRWKVK